MNYKVALQDAYVDYAIFMLLVVFKIFEMAALHLEPVWNQESFFKLNLLDLSFHMWFNSQCKCVSWTIDCFTTLSIVLMAEDTDNETGHVLQGMESLPPILKRFVREDNQWFQQQLREWEEQFHQASRDEPQVPVALVLTSKEENASEPEHPNPEPEPDQEHGHNKPEEPTPEAEQALVQDSEGRLLFQLR